jgi:hypothetical protein
MSDRPTVLAESETLPNDLTRYHKALEWAGDLAGNALIAAYRREDWDEEREMHDIANSLAYLRNELTLLELRRRKEEARDGDGTTSV